MPKAKKLAFRILEEADVPVDTLVDDPLNANVHTEENLAAIQASIETFGQVERLVVRKKDKMVFAGNGRTAVLRRMGTKRARVQYVDGPDELCRAYAIASNQTTRMSRFDDEILLTTLQDIQAHDTSGLLAATGFTLEDLGDLEAQLNDEHDQQAAALPNSEASMTVKCPKCAHSFRVGGKK